MKPLIVANWKSNPETLKKANLLFDTVEKGIKNVCSNLNSKIEIVICPSYAHLSVVDHKSKIIKLGAQNCFWEERGAYTGEVSSIMLKDLGVKYAILGHSERRHWFGETDKMINKKIKAVISAGIRPIFCIGETEDERNKFRTQAVIKSQLEKGLKKIPKIKIKNIIIAYEPVWAVGTGSSCNLNEAMSAALLIQKVLSNLYNRAVIKNVPILYGGSVDKENAMGYIKEARMNGLLIGGASLDSREFIKIIKSVSRV